MENNPATPLSTLAIARGGVEILVQFLDDHEEMIKVRQLPLRQMAQYGNVQGDESKLCELFTGKDAAWVDALTTESQEAIVTTGDLLNTDFFLRWAERRLAANQRLLPMVPALGLAKSASPSSPAAATPPTN